MTRPCIAPSLPISAPSKDLSTHPPVHRLTYISQNLVQTFPYTHAPTPAHLSAYVGNVVAPLDQAPRHQALARSHIAALDHQLEMTNQGFAAAMAAQGLAVRATDRARFEKVQQLWELWGGQFYPPGMFDSVAEIPAGAISPLLTTTRVWLDHAPPADRDLRRGLWGNWNGLNQEPDGVITTVMREAGNPRLTVWVANEAMNRVKDRFGVRRPGAPPPQPPQQPQPQPQPQPQQQQQQQPRSRSASPSPSPSPSPSSPPSDRRTPGTPPDDG